MSSLPLTTWAIRSYQEGQREAGLSLPLSLCQPPSSSAQEEEEEEGTHPSPGIKRNGEKPPLSIFQSLNLFKVLCHCRILVKTWLC